MHVCNMHFAQSIVNSTTRECQSAALCAQWLWFIHRQELCLAEGCVFTNFLHCSGAFPRLSSDVCRQEYTGITPALIARCSTYISHRCNSYLSRTNFFFQLWQERKSRVYLQESSLHGHQKTVVVIFAELEFDERSQAGPLTSISAKHSRN